MKKQTTAVFRIGDLENIMTGLEYANPSFAPAYDVLRVSLGIEPDAPKTVWTVKQTQLKNGKREI